MQDGTTRPLETVAQGNEVLSKDEQTRRAVRLTRRTVGRVVRLTLTDPATHQSQTLTAMEDHPVYMQGQGFVPAGQFVSASGTENVRVYIVFFFGCPYGISQDN